MLASPCDDTRDIGILDDPGDRELGKGDAEFFGDRLYYTISKLICKLNVLGQRRYTSRFLVAVICFFNSSSVLNFSLKALLKGSEEVERREPSGILKSLYFPLKMPIFRGEKVVRPRPCLA